MKCVCGRLHFSYRFLGYHARGMREKIAWKDVSRTKIAASALTIAVKFRRVTCTANLVSRRLIDAVPRNDAAPGSVTAFATHNTVGNSPLPRLYNAAARPICAEPSRAEPRRAARAARVATSLKKTLRYRKRRVTFTGARVFLENTFLPRGFGTRSRRKCQPAVVSTHSRDPYTVNFRSVGPGRRDPFGAIRLNTSALLSITIPAHSDIYIYLYQFPLLRVCRVQKKIIPNVYIFTTLRNL